KRETRNVLVSLGPAPRDTRARPSARDRAVRGRVRERSPSPVGTRRAPDGLPTRRWPAREGVDAPAGRRETTPEGRGGSTAARWPWSRERSARPPRAP